jgi:hypothetical protein
VVVMKISTSWDIARFTKLHANRRFGGTCRLHLQGRRISQARNRREAGHCLLLASCWFLTCLLRPLKIDVTYSSETSVEFKRTTRHYIPEDKTRYTTIIANFESRRERGDPGVFERTIWGRQRARENFVFIIQSYYKLVKKGFVFSPMQQGTRAIFMSTFENMRTGSLYRSVLNPLKTARER